MDPKVSHTPAPAPSDGSASGSDDSLLSYGLRHARRVVVGVVGTTVLLVGIALLVLPGPGFVVIAAGLGILAAEFAWARRWLRIARERAQEAIDAAQGKNRGD